LRDVQKDLGDRRDFWNVLPLCFENARFLVISAELVDLGFEENHVALVVGVFFVFLHVNCHALCFLHEVAEVFRHCRCKVLGFENCRYALARDWFHQRNRVLVA